MRTDNCQSSCSIMLYHMMIKLLFTGEVYQYKGLKVYSSIFGKKYLLWSIFGEKILSLQYNSFHEKTMEYFYEETSLNMKHFYWQNDSCLSGGCT